MSPQQSGKWVKDKELLFPPDESCYLYKRPRSNVWQYFLSISPEEGSERKSTKESDLEKARDDYDKAWYGRLIQELEWVLHHESF